MSAVRRKVYLACAAGFVIGAALSAPIAHLLAIRSTAGLIETFGAGALWTIACFERALLQARQAYPAYASNLLLEGVLRCGVTLGAVGAGLGVPGAAAGLLISLPSRDRPCRLGRAPARRAPPPAPGEPAVRRAATGRARHDALLALAALGLLAVLQNVDVLVLGRHDPAPAAAATARCRWPANPSCSSLSCWPASCCRRRRPGGPQAITR